MLYLADFLIGFLSIFSFSIFYYLIRPNHFFLTINQKELSRGNILLYWFLFTLIIFIILCIAIPKDNVAEQSGTDLILSLFGMVAAIFSLKHGSNNKIDIDKNKKASEQFKEDWQKFKAEIKPQKADIPELPKVTVTAKVTYEESKSEPKPQSVEDFHEEVESFKGLNPADLFRYELDYKDRFGNKTTRYIDVIAVQKEWGNNRWYFVADTEDGERTFKSERVIELRDSWTGEVFSSSKSVREHIVKNYPETDDAFDD